MANTNDTIDGLLAEFRGYSAGMPASYHVTMSWADFRRMLDRFDAAHRREKAAIEADALAVGGIVEAARKRERGDAAKLREALKHIKDRLPHMLQYMRVHWEDASAGGYFDELMLVINAALAAPPRNCDVGTAEEQSDRMDAAYCSKRLCAKGKCPLFKPGGDCSLIWAQMPYEEGGDK